MIELGQLEGQWQEFQQRKVKLVVASVEGRAEAQATQDQFPHLLVVSDPEHRLVDAVAVLHPHAGPNKEDIAAPTTLLVDGRGTVRWTFRPDRVLTRLRPAELLAAIDREMPAD